MARAARVCKHSGCPRTAVRGGECSDHAKQTDEARGTPAERGYGAEHRQRRAALLRVALGHPCPRCGKQMTRFDRLELDHSTPLRVDPSSVGDVIVHARCNPKGTSAENYRQH